MRSRFLRSLSLGSMMRENGCMNVLPMLLPVFIYLQGSLCLFLHLSLSLSHQQESKHKSLLETIPRSSIQENHHKISNNILGLLLFLSFPTHLTPVTLHPLSPLDEYSNIPLSSSPSNNYPSSKQRMAPRVIVVGGGRESFSTHPFPRFHANQLLPQYLV